MANTKISALPNASTLSGTEQIPAVQSGGDVKLTPAQIKTYIGGGSPGGSNYQLQYNNSSAFGGISFGTSGNPLVSSGSSAAPYFASAGVWANSGTNLAITAQTTTDVPLVAKGMASQSGDLQQWQNSSGSALAKIGAAGALTLGVQQTAQGNLVLSNTAAGAYATTIQSSNSASAAWTLTLPTTAGTNAYVLQTDGSGNTSWVAQSGGSSTLTVNTTATSGATAGQILYSDGSKLQAGGAVLASSLALGGATIGSNALAVTGTSALGSGTLGGGFTGTIYAIGSSSNGGTITPAIGNGNHQSLTNAATAAWTLAAPTGITSGTASEMKITVTNAHTGTLVAPTLSGFAASSSTSAYTLTNDATFDFYFAMDYLSGGSNYVRLTVVAR